VWLVFVLVLSVTTASVAQDAGLVLTLGRLSTDQYGASQVISVENRTSRSFSIIEVECGFYAGNKLVGNGDAIIRELRPGSTGHSNAASFTAADADIRESKALVVGGQLTTSRAVLSNGAVPNARASSPFAKCFLSPANPLSPTSASAGSEPF
jgi:hypothetical protein